MGFPKMDDFDGRLDGLIRLHHKFCLGRILAGVIALVSVRMIPWVPAGFDVGPTP